MNLISVLQLNHVVTPIYLLAEVLLHASHEAGNLNGVLLGGFITVTGAIYSWWTSKLSGIQTIWIGIALEVAGFGGDAYWHGVHGGEEIGLIPPAHWLIILGSIVALVGAIKAWQHTDGPTAYTAATASVTAAAQVVGAVWDNSLHYSGIEPASTALPHLLQSIGLILLVLSVLVMTGIEWRAERATPTK